MDSYINSNKLLTATMTDITFDVNRYIDSSITHTPGSAIFTVNYTGTYLIISTINSSATTKSYTNLQLMSNTSGSYQIIPGSLSYSYHNDSTNNKGSTTTFVIVNLIAGDSIKVQASHSVSTINIIDGSSMYIACLKSSTNNQINQKYFNAYNTASQTLTTLNVYVDNNWNNTNVTNNIYSYTTGTAPITLNETGKYLILYKVSCNNAGTLATREDIAQSRIVIDTNNTNVYTDVPASVSCCFVGALSPFYKATNISFCMLYIKSGSKIKLQTLKTLTNAVMTTVINSCSLSIIKLDTTPILTTLTPVILNYGSYFQYVMNNSISSTTSTTYQQKLSLYTTQIPEGVYRIDIGWQVAPIASAKDLKVRVIVDDISVIHEMIISYSSTQTQIITDFAFISLSAGFHEIRLDYATVAAANSGIYNTKLSIYRVS